MDGELPPVHRKGNDMTVWLIHETVRFHGLAEIFKVVEVCRTEQLAYEWIRETMKIDDTRVFTVHGWNVTERLSQ
jgi:hypothetical protein